MKDFQQASSDYTRIEQAISFLENNFKQQPSLTEIASEIGLSEFHFQKLFKRWVGISPKRFLQYLTKEYAKTLLHNSENILNVSYETGLSSPGRLHDLFVQCEALTPGEYKNSGLGLEIEYGFHSSPFGDCLVAITEKGICGMYFIPAGKHERYRYILKNKWKHARIVENAEHTVETIEKIFSDSNWNPNSPYKIVLHGTNFQIKVWEALLRIPQGNVVTYEDVAKYIGTPKAVRAVGSAVASNPISYLIPCHRVIRKMGVFGNYQGGTARKKAILGWEAAKAKHNQNELFD